MQFVSKVARTIRTPINRSLCSTPRVFNVRKEFSKNDRDPNWEAIKKCQKQNQCQERADECNEVIKNHPPPYQQAWCDNFELPPKPLYVPRECCVIEPPRRARKTPNAANSGSICQSAKPSCGSAGIDRCAKLTLNRCKPARNPTTCVRITPPILCIPLRTPMPSFHDCIKDPVKPLPPNECHCFDKQPPCTPTRRRLLADR